MTIETPDLASPEFKRNPHPFFARLRREAPVTAIMQGGRTVWMVTRYADVAAGLKDERFTKDRYNGLTPEERKKHLPWLPAFVRPIALNMLDQDPPNHTRLRKLVQKAFTPMYVEKLRGRIEAYSHELIDGMLARGSADLVRDFALPIPLRIISDMLGVPEKDRKRFGVWSQRAVSVSQPLDLLLVIPYLWKFIRFSRYLIDLRRREPGPDLLSDLVRAEEGGDHLSEDELVGMVFLLLIAGHETTVNLISSGVLELMNTPEQLERLRAQPDLGKTAVEELLRLTSPVEFATERYTREPVEMSGVTIPKGERVHLIIGSANRDEAQFPDADRMDLAREPNKHVAFGHGAHYCVGAPLARLEAQIAFRALLDRCAELSLAVPPEQLKWRRSVLLRGLRALPVNVRAAQRRAVA